MPSPWVYGIYNIATFGIILGSHYTRPSLCHELMDYNDSKDSSSKCTDKSKNKTRVISYGTCDIYIYPFIKTVLCLKPIYSISNATDSGGESRQSKVSQKFHAGQVG